jgi:hypothetical protein
MPWSKKPKIEVQEVVEQAGGAPIAYYARGRFSPGEFRKAVEAHAGRKVDGRPLQEFWRDVKQQDGDLDTLFKRCTVFDQGAYAVTVLDLESWDR